MARIIDGNSDSYRVGTPEDDFMNGGGGDDSVRGGFFFIDLDADPFGFGLPPQPPSGAPVIDVNLRGGRADDSYNITARQDGCVAWVKIEGFSPAEGDSVHFHLMDTVDNLLVSDDDMFRALDKNDDARLDAADQAAGLGAEPFAEVVVDGMGLHLRAGDDWLTLVGRDSATAADFEVPTAVAGDFLL
jgi:hypothetical protein